MRRRASEQGAVAPTSLLAAAVLAVAIGAAGYAMTSGHPDQVDKHTSTQPLAQPSVTPKPTAHPTHRPTHATPPAIVRGNYTVIVYNNTSITGMAGAASTKAKNFGWNVLTPKQWTASLLTTPTIFYPPTMQDAARQLGTDLGITTLEPATSAMAPDQLTVILTSSYPH